MRNKHIAHDVNALSQSLPGDVLNKRDAEYKIAKVICFGTETGTLEPTAYANLCLLVEKALEYCEQQFDEIAEGLAAQLEAEHYDTLEAMPTMQWTKPTNDDVGKTKNR